MRSSNTGFNELSYYPFGMVMPGRQFQSGSGYRYGFQGQEKDNEIKGLTSRCAELEGKLSATREFSTADVQSLKDEIARLQSELRTASEQTLTDGLQRAHKEEMMANL